MGWETALVLLIGGVCGLLILGLPVAFAFFGVIIVGSLLFMGGLGSLATFPTESLEAVGKFALIPIPLFILMGEILFHTGVAFRAIDAIDKLIVHVRGRLAVVTLCGGTLFASLSGSTIANTALLGNVLLPRMLQLGYSKSISMGSIMAVGGIAMLIPPSALAVLLASLAEQNIAALLIAGIVPGALMAVLFVAYVLVRCAMNPKLAPDSDDNDGSERPRGRRAWRPFLTDVLPLLGIFAVVIGSMLSGTASPTEASALGCAATVLACACYRSLSPAKLKRAVLETAKISTMILFIIAGSLTFSQILVISGATNGLLEQVKALQLTDLALVLIMLGVLLFLGFFMDQVSMILITLPIFMPLAVASGIETIWLMLLMLLAMEIALLTPPFGLLLFVMKGVAPPNISLTSVYAAAFPFVLLKLAVMAVLIAIPVLATFLPSLILR